MNERIKELAKEAGAYFGGGSTDHFGNYLPPYMSIRELDAEKFAELIVRECLTFVKPMPGSGDIDDLALEAAREGIKEHFGVEE